MSRPDIVHAKHVHVQGGAARCTRERLGTVRKQAHKSIAFRQSVKRAAIAFEPAWECAQARMLPRERTQARAILWASESEREREWASERVSRRNGSRAAEARCQWIGRQRLRIDACVPNF